MKIGVDIRAAIDEPAGIGTLALNFSRQLPSFGSDEFFLYGDKGFDFGLAGGNVHNVVPFSIGRAAWHVAALADARRRRIDRFVSFGSLQIAAMTRGFVLLVIPDLSHILMPQLHEAKSRFTGKVLMKRALARARKVAAISEHTRQDILRFAGSRIDKSDVLVAHAACDDLYRNPPTEEDTNRVRRQYDLHRPYILTVGTLEPRKNIPGLIGAFAAATRGNDTHDLVIAGKKGWLYESIFEEVKRGGVESRVRFAGFVPLRDMPSLYAMADLFVYPSLYEGFGIPPLEAMTCGVPVITSNVSSLPEVAGDAAVLIDPRDEQELAAQLRKLLNNAELRRRYAEAGRERAKRFSWRRFAEQLLAALHE